MKPCGCCQGIQRLTPLGVENRPGLPALSYRVGTHATFLETMQARLASANFPALREHLTTRAGSDPALALLDAWATLADVLTFYQERIANEGYLRTATERRSILELARLVGYRLRPGVAATVYLAFTLEKDHQVEIPAGTRAQSLPGPGELPQSFETAEPLVARAAWNALQPRQTLPQFITAGTTVIYLQGIATNLKANDPLVIVDSLGNRLFRRALEVKPDPVANRTRVLLVGGTPARPALNLLPLEILLQRVPEEEGPYSKAIGDWGTAILREELRPLLTRLRAAQPAWSDLRQAIKAQLPRLAQLRRINLTLNFEILAGWIADVEQQLQGLLEQVQRYAGPPPSTAPSEDQLEIIWRLRSGLRAALERPPTLISGRPFAKEIGVPEYQALQSALQDLVQVLGGSAGLEDKLLALREKVPLLQQFRHTLGELGLLGDEGQEWVRHQVNMLNETIQQLSAPETGTGVTAARPSPLLWDSLLRLPSRQPASPLDLERRLDTLFQPQSALASQLLVTMQPSLAPTLYLAQRKQAVQGQPAEVYALRTTAALFGHNARQRVLYNSDGRPQLNTDGTIQTTEWTPANDETGGVLFLDNAYDKIAPASYIVVVKPGSEAQVLQVNQATIHPRTAYEISGKTTELQLSSHWCSEVTFALIRETAVYAQSERLELAEAPLEETDGPITGDALELDGLYDGLEIGRWLIVSGECAETGIQRCERVMLAGVTEGVRQVVVDAMTRMALPGDTPHTTLHFAAGLAYTYRRATVILYGNVVKATHGETRTEVLGSGDGSQRCQAFTLRQSPLTYVSAPTGTGVESTLRVWVNDVEWHEVGDLLPLAPTDHRFITRTNDAGQTTLIFGDGEHGARLPTGVENLQARYRTGIGRPGNLAAGRISLLATRPLGVKAVVNPLPATGGADPESREQARRNAPLGVLALDRLVSVTDYADFARTFAGIGKASAARLSDGRRELVHLTIAGIDDIPLDPDSDLCRNLGAALRRRGDPWQPCLIEPREWITLVISAGIGLDPDYRWEKVEPQLRAALLAAFSFERRELGQDAVLGEVISVLQQVPGVVYVDVDTFGGLPERIVDPQTGRRRPQTPEELIAAVKALVEASETTGRPPTRVTARLAGRENGTLRPAQLAYLTPAVPETLILTQRIGKRN